MVPSGREMVAVDRPKVPRGGESITRLRELRMVEEVKEFEAKFELETLGQAGVFEDGGIKVDRAGAIEGVLAQVWLLVERC